MARLAEGCPRLRRTTLRAMRAMLLLGVLASAPAVEEIFVAFDPRPTPADLDWRANADLRYDAEADHRDGPGGLAFDREAFGASWLGVRGERDEGWLNLRASRTGIDGDARLSSGASPEGDYLDVAAGATWKRLLGGGNVVGVMANATLDGQAPVDDGMEWGGTATAFCRLGLGAEGADGLILAINYDPDRVIFGNIPLLPLAAWQGIRGPWIMVLGVPFSVITYRQEDWRISSVIGPLPSLSADHRISGPWRVFGEARWTRQQWRRADRAEDDARLELSQWEWSGGLRLGFGPMIQFDLFAGAATARRLGEDADSTEARRDGIALEAAPFAAFRGRIVF